MGYKLTYLVIHCTATPEGRNVSSDDIRSWHLSPVPKGRGWKQVGYSDMIHLDGTVENLVKYNNDSIVDAWEITNGASGINSKSRHVVYVGGCPKGDLTSAKDTRTPEQLKALEQYVKKTIQYYPNILIAGHYHFQPNKFCPSFNVEDWLKSIRVSDKNIYKK